MSYTWRHRAFHRAYDPQKRRSTLAITVLTLAVVGLGLGLRVEPNARGWASTAAPARVGIYPLAPHTQPLADADPQAVELGVRFTVSVPGTIVAVRFYRNRANAGPHTGSLWSASGTLLATARFNTDSTVGWVIANLSHPVDVKPGHTYVASYHTTVGHYAAQTGVFANGHTIGVSPLITGHLGVFRYGSGGYPTHAWSGSAYFVDALFVPSGTPSKSPSTVSASTPSPTKSPAPPNPPAAGFPNDSNTGIPASTVLSEYTGPMVITRAGTVVSSKSIAGDLRIEAANVTVEGSRISGDVRIDSDDAAKGYSFTIEDSDVNAGGALGQDAYDGTGIGAVNFTALRVNVTGGKLSVNCFLNCTVKDSYLHSQATDQTGQTHEGGIRVGANSTVLHNTIACEAQNVEPNAGCSGDFTGYGDFGPVENVLVQDNYFVSETTGGGVCAYGGSSAGKPYSNDANHVRFIGNTFGKGETNDHGVKDCAYYAAVTDFDSSAPGNVFTGNVYTDGTPVAP